MSTVWFIPALSIFGEGVLRTQCKKRLRYSDVRNWMNSERRSNPRRIDSVGFGIAFALSYLFLRTHVAKVKSTYKSDISTLRAIMDYAQLTRTYPRSDLHSRATR
ncbi:MAG: hypothetical protein H7308_08910 [Chthonomonadaceae bacterium]|nr:hypothetical protein [Chthonomonadaceae bacterium]